MAKKTPLEELLAAEKQTVADLREQLDGTRRELASSQQEYALLRQQNGQLEARLHEARHMAERLRDARSSVLVAKHAFTDQATRMTQIAEQLQRALGWEGG